HRWMHAQLLHAAALEGIDPGVVPNIGPVATLLAQPEIVDVRDAAHLEHEHELVFGAIEGPHPRVGLVPYAEVLQLVGVAGGGPNLTHVTPVHADLMDRPVFAVTGGQTHEGGQESGELALAHFAGCHLEVAMVHRAEATDMAVDPYVVGRVGEHH